MEIIQEFVFLLAEYIIMVFNVIAIVVITWGVFDGILSILMRSFSLKSKVNYWKNFILKLLASLEFLLAADIMHTIISPHFEAMLQVAFIIAIRAILNYVLEREIKEGTINEIR